MSNNPMITQVNRLVSDLLAGGGEVFLPGVGSLYTERQGAQRLGRGRVQPPCRVVSFQTSPRGVSLVDEIAAAAQCEVTVAQDIYDRWLAQTYAGNTLTIEGVGILKFKNLQLDDAFDLRLNPQGRKPLRVHAARRFDWALWVGIVAILIVVLIGGYQFLMMYPDSESEPLAQAQIEIATQPIVEQPDSAIVAQEFEAGAVSSESPVSPTESTAATARPVATASAPATLVAGRFYVVLGVFSTSENAARAAAAAQTRKPSLRFDIYRFNGKYLLSPFDAADAAACTQFIRTEADLAPDMWTYTAR